MKHYNNSIFLSFKIVNNIKKELLLTILLLLFLPPYSQAGLLNPDNFIAGPDTTTTIESEITSKNLKNDFFQQLESFDNSNSEARDLLKKGYNHLQRGDTKRGLTELIKAQNTDPKLVLPGILISLTYIKIKNYKKAFKSALIVQQSHPDKPEGFTLEGIIHALENQPAKAKAAFTKAYQINPGDTNSGVNLARYAINDKQYSKARIFYQQILKKNPDSFSTITLLAKLELSLNRTPDAINLLNKKLSEYPEADKVRDLLVRIYYSQGEYQKILQLTKQLSENNVTQYPSLLEFRGKTQIQIGKIKDAINSFKQLVFQLPTSAAAHFMLAKAYLKNNKLSEALSEVQQSIRLKPDYLQARLAEIKLLAFNNKEQQAEQRVKILHKDFKDNLNINSTAAWLAMRHGNYSEAYKQYKIIAEKQINTDITKQLFLSVWQQKNYNHALLILEKWLEKHPDDIAIRSLLSDAYLSIKHNKEAITSYHKLIQIAPEYAQGYNNLALLLQKENLKKALILARKAHSLEKDNIYIMDTLATLLLANKQLAEAKLLFEKAVKLKPQAFSVQYHYAELLIQQKNYGKARPILTNIIEKTTDSQIKIKARILLNTFK